MAIDPAFRLLEIQIQQQLCQMHSSDFDNVTGWELNPLVSLLQIIKEEYSCIKPEVYRTILAVLNDYKPISGEKHRQKTLRYLKLLLCCNPELADLMTRVLPPAVTVSAQYSQCLQSANAASNKQKDTEDNRAAKSVHTSPATNLPITSTSDSPLLWPIAVHAATPASQPVHLLLPTASNSQLQSTAEHTAKSVIRTPQAMMTSQPTAFTLGGLESGRFMFVNNNPAFTVLRTSAVPLQAAGKPVALPRCLIIRPVSSTAADVASGTVLSSLPNAPTVSVTNKSTVPQIVRIPSNIRQMLVPRVIARPTFTVPTPATTSRVIQAKAAVPVPQPQQQLTLTSNNLQSLAAVSQVAAAEQTGKVSPFSCIQTLVANAEAAPTQLVAIDAKTPDNSSPAVSQPECPACNENEMFIHLTVSADNTGNSGFAGLADDPDVNPKQASCVIRKRVSTTDESDDLQNKIAKQS